MGQTNLYSDITEVGGDIFHLEYQDILFQRNILAVFVISLTSLCMYLIFTRTSSAVKDISNKPKKGFANLFAGDFMKREGGSKKESGKEEDSDDDDVDSFMKNIRKMTTPKNEVSRSQQQLSSNVQVEAFGSDINSMMDKIRVVAVSNQITPEKAELVDGMFGLMEGMGKNFMSQWEQVAAAADSSTSETITSDSFTSETITSETPSLDNSETDEPNPSES